MDATDSLNSKRGMTPEVSFWEKDTVEYQTRSARAIDVLPKRTKMAMGQKPNRTPSEHQPIQPLK